MAFADALDLLDPCFDLDRLTEQLHFLASLNNAASQCADCLIASKQNRTLRSPEVVFQMMADTARITHAGCRDDNLRFLVEVDCNGIAAGDREMQTRERNRIDALFYQLLPSLQQSIILLSGTRRSLPPPSGCLSKPEIRRARLQGSSP